MGGKRGTTALQRPIGARIGFRKAQSAGRDVPTVSMELRSFVGASRRLGWCDAKDHGDELDGLERSGRGTKEWEGRLERSGERVRVIRDGDSEIVHGRRWGPHRRVSDD